MKFRKLQGSGLRLIYITGIDGCGKTTQAKMLAAHLNKKGIQSQYQWLRWSPSIGKMISLLKRNGSGNVERSAHLQAADNRDVQGRENDSFNQWVDFKAWLFSSSIFKFLWIKYATWDYFFAYKKAASKWCTDILILDRYYFDFIVDQSLNFQESVINFEKIVETGCLKKIRQPDLFVLIDIPAETGWDRKMDGTSLAHLLKLENAYKSVESRKNVHVINGLQTVDEIHGEIKNLVSDFLRRGDNEL